MKLADPESKQYTTKGVSVCVLKYLVKNFTERYEAIAAPTASSSAVWDAAACLDSNSVGNLSTAAAPIMGVANKKENLSASSCAKPTMSPPAIVDPVRENPGNSASTCIPPTLADCHHDTSAA